MTTVQCLACAFFSMDKPAGEVSRMGTMGYGRCKHTKGEEKHVTSEFRRHCREYVATDEATKEKRIAWLAGQRTKLIREVTK